MNLVDSCGWLEYFVGGPNAGFFEPAIHDTEHLVVPTICIYEAYRRTLDQRGETPASVVAGAMRQGRVISLTNPLALDAARLGLHYKLPLADSIILATAQLCKATLWTQDAHFEKIPGVHYRPKN